MKKLCCYLKNKGFGLRMICSMALLFATLGANSRCVYIYHNPQKPASLDSLNKGKARN